MGSLLLYRRSVTWLLVFFIGGLCAMVWVAFRLEASLVETIGVNDAAFHSSVLREFRTLYSSEVVERVRDRGITASHDYPLHEGHIPLPATFSLLLGNRLSMELGADVRLYSAYPFPWRSDGGPPR